MQKQNLREITESLKRKDSGCFERVFVMYDNCLKHDTSIYLAKEDIKDW